MPASYKSVKDAIVNTLNTLVPASLQIVYAKEEKSPNKFPCATVSDKAHSGEFHTVGSGGANKRTYEHFVRLYFRVDELNDPDYEDILATTADAVITALDHDITLGGTVDWAIVSSSQWGEGDKEVPLRVCEMVVSSVGHITR